MSDFNGRIGGYTPPSHSCERHVVQCKNWTHQSSGDWPRKGSSFLWETFNGEAITVDEARDATFLLTGAGKWVGKSAYLNTDPMTIQEGKRAIGQAITDC